MPARRPRSAAVSARATPWRRQAALALLLAGGVALQPLTARANAGSGAHAPAAGQPLDDTAAPARNARGPSPVAVGVEGPSRMPGPRPALRQAAAPAAPAAAVGSAHGPAAAAPSLDALRQRLSDRLGAVPAPSAPAGVMRVTSRTTAPADAQAGAGNDGHALAPAAAAPHGDVHVHAPAPRRRQAASAHATPAAHKGGAHGGVGHGGGKGGGHGAGKHAHWAYDGQAGPERWAKLDPAFAACAVGERQSPIDIRGGLKLDLDPIRFDYQPVAFKVVDNGHTVQVNPAFGNGIEVQGRRFDLVQFHFHRPSEERIDGKQFDMVVHLVHKDADGKLAVVAVLLDRGSAHPVMQQVWNNLPLDKNIETPASTPIDLNNLLPADRRYFTYMGSLTTPPCSEGVLWMVMKQPVPMSAEQIGTFAKLYPMNARPIQRMAGRLIKSN